MGGGTRTKTTQEPQVPQHVADVSQASTEAEKKYQEAAPLTGFAAAAPQKMPPLPGREKALYAKIPQLADLGKRRVTGANITTSPAWGNINEAFDVAIKPTIENQAVLGGLGRSSALTNATAAARANYVAPFIESELGREERGLAN